MRSHSKIRLFFCSFFALGLTSCIKSVEDPAKAYNTQFLAKNWLKISRAKKKHKKIAKDYGIMYDKEKERAKVEKDAYKHKLTAKSRGYFVLKGEENVDNYLKENIKYLGDENTIYYKESKVIKNNLVDKRSTDDFPILYLADNYGDYKLDKKTQKKIDVADEDLYGSWDKRKEKSYNQIDQDEILVSFDYIDLLSRVRTEVYFDELEREEGGVGVASSLVNIAASIKNKIFNIFKTKK
ncbi:MAG: hypothetical protein LBG48_04375 [Rickettsiales bacterium]|jgi:hypothetical protein|nr:hypothetical protein [Rickettsiales bacterium]